MSFPSLVKLATNISAVYRIVFTVIMLYEIIKYRPRRRK